MGWASPRLSGHERPKPPLPWEGRLRIARSICRAHGFHHLVDDVIVFRMGPRNGDIQHGGLGTAYIDECHTHQLVRGGQPFPSKLSLNSRIHAGRPPRVTASLRMFSMVFGCG